MPPLLLVAMIVLGRLADPPIPSVVARQVRSPIAHVVRGEEKEEEEEAPNSNISAVWAFVLSMNRSSSLPTNETRLGQFRNAWAAVGVPWSVVVTEFTPQKGAGSAFGHRRAWALAEQQGCVVCIFLEDDAVPFHSSTFREAAARVFRHWPASSRHLLLGGWHVERAPGFSLNASLRDGVGPITAALGAYGYAVRGRHLKELMHWADTTIFSRPRRKYSIDMAVWAYWATHGPASIATPLLVDHSDGYSFTHRTYSPRRKVWQGRDDWYNVWPELEPGTTHLPWAGF
jgi:hypothetical protein